MLESLFCLLVCWTARHGFLCRFTAINVVTNQVQFSKIKFINVFWKYFKAEVSGRTCVLKFRVKHKSPEDKSSIFYLKRVFCLSVFRAKGFSVYLTLESNKPRMKSWFIFMLLIWESSNTSVRLFCVCVVRKKYDETAKQYPHINTKVATHFLKVSNFHAR